VIPPGWTNPPPYYLSPAPSPHVDLFVAQIRPDEVPFLYKYHVGAYFNVPYGNAVQYLHLEDLWLYGGGFVPYPYYPGYGELQLPAIAVGNY
jgi:hypothetical protein